MTEDYQSLSGRAENQADRLHILKPEQVTEVIRAIEVPFLEKMRDTYKNQGWRICGETSTALSRILSLRLGVPLQGLKKEEGGAYIEVALGMYDPVNEPDRFNKIEEETYIRFHLGDGTVLFIDGIYELLMEKKPLSSGVILVERYDEATIDDALERNHNIYPYTQRLQALENDPQFPPKKIPTPQQAKDIIDALNDERGTFAFIVGNDEPRTPHRMTASAVKPIIREFGLEPNWQEDNKSKLVQTILYKKQMQAKRKEERLQREEKAKRKRLEREERRQRRADPT